MYDYILTDEQNKNGKASMSTLNHGHFERPSSSQENAITNSYREHAQKSDRKENIAGLQISRGEDLTDNFSEDDSLDNVNISDGKSSPKVSYGKKSKKSHGPLTRK